MAVSDSSHAGSDSEQQTKDSMDDYIRWIIGDDDPVGKFLVETRQGQIAIADVEQFSHQVRNNLRAQQRERAGLEPL